MRLLTHHQRIKALREGMYTKRCHTLPCLGDVTYTVGLHSANALVLLYALYPGQPSHNLVQALLTHDSVERFLGDMPRPAKEQFPELGAAYTAAERAMEKMLKIDFPLTPEEVNWLKAIDALELLLWVFEQEAQGSSNVGEWKVLLTKVLFGEDSTAPQEVKAFANYEPSRLKEATYYG